mmetsp:Transcript_21560/g.19128  ORF Transcript_21560/g.19128 Transcript_21560/m.19128 type:complete len:206 (-) Transcript_21560:20-637(-)
MDNDTIFESQKSSTWTTRTMPTKSHQDEEELMNDRILKSLLNSKNKITKLNKKNGSGLYQFTKMTPQHQNKVIKQYFNKRMRALSPKIDKTIGKKYFKNWNKIDFNNCEKLQTFSKSQRMASPQTHRVRTNQLKNQFLQKKSALLKENSNQYLLPTIEINKEEFLDKYSVQKPRSNRSRCSSGSSSTYQYNCVPRNKAIFFNKSN